MPSFCLSIGGREGRFLYHHGNNSIKNILIKEVEGKGGLDGEKG